MKFFIATLLTALLSFFAGVYVEWWWFFAVVAFLVAVLVHQKGWKAFLSGFLALLLLWGGLAFWIEVKNQGVLSAKIAELFPLGGSGFMLVLITGFIAALVAGFAALSGSSLRSSGTGQKD